jgi:zinc transport system substrate-binding protein
MKRAAYLLSALLLFGCARKEEPAASGKPVVFASIMPQAGLARAIAGDRAEIHVLIGEGQSPHAYEPTARQLARLGEADLLLAIGMPFEKHLLKKIAPLYPDLSIVGTEKGIKLRNMRQGSHGATDPHIWLNPANAAIIAENIFQALEKTDPAHADEYHRNSNALAKKLKQLDAEIRAMLAPYKGRRFYVFHPSFGYFADAYGLKQVAIELDGKVPSPRQLAALIDRAKADGVKTVFVQKQFPADSAKAIANAIGGKVVPLDPLAEDCVANLRLIAESLKEGFSTP